MYTAKIPSWDYSSLWETITALSASCPVRDASSSGSSTGLTPVCVYLCYSGEPTSVIMRRPGPCTQYVTHQCWLEWKNHLPWPAGLATNAAWEAVGSYSVSTRISRVFSIMLLSRWSIPSMYWCLGLFLPKCRTLHFSLRNCRRLPPAWFLSPLGYLWMAAQPSNKFSFPLLSKL